MKILNDVEMNTIVGGLELEHAVSGTTLDAEQVQTGLGAVQGIAEIQIAAILVGDQDVEGVGEDGINEALDNK